MMMFIRKWKKELDTEGASSKMDLILKNKIKKKPTPSAFDVAVLK